MANKKKAEKTNRVKPVPATKQPEPKKEKQVVSAGEKPEPAQPSVKRARVGFAEVLRRALIVLLALGIGCGGAWAAVSYRAEQLQKKITLSYSGVLQQDCLFPIDFEDGQVRAFLENTKRRGQTRAFTFFCNQTLSLDRNSMSGYILFGNPAGNDCTLVLSVTDEAGDLIYRSGGVEPGKYITQIRPLFDLPEGVHNCTAYVSGYTPTGDVFRYDCVGVQYMPLTVEVGEPS